MSSVTYKALLSTRITQKNKQWSDGQVVVRADGTATLLSEEGKLLGTARVTRQQIEDAESHLRFWDGYVVEIEGVEEQHAGQQGPPQPGNGHAAAGTAGAIPALKRAPSGKPLVLRKAHQPFTTKKPFVPLRPSGGSSAATSGRQEQEPSGGVRGDAGAQAAVLGGAPMPQPRHHTAPGMSFGSTTQSFTAAASAAPVPPGQNTVTTQDTPQGEGKCWGPLPPLHRAHGAACPHVLVRLAKQLHGHTHASLPLILLPQSQVSLTSCLALTLLCQQPHLLHWSLHSSSSCCLPQRLGHQAAAPGQWALLHGPFQPLLLLQPRPQSAHQRQTWTGEEEGKEG